MFHLRVMLEYFHPWPNSAGFYLARERGYYRDAGIDLELCVHDPVRGDALAHLLRGEVDFAVCPGNRLLVRRALRQALVSVAAINQCGLESIQTLAASGIRRPRELAGKRVALNPTSRGLAMIRHIVRADGGDPDAILIVDSGARELRPEELAEGKADASFGGYWAWEALMESRIPDSERIVLPLTETAAPRYHSYLLATGSALLAAEPERVRAFLEATALGFQEVAAAPQSALPLFERVTPYFPQALLAASLDKIAPTWLHEGRWGVQREALIAPYAEWLAENAIMARADAWREAYDNSYLPELA